MRTLVVCLLGILSLVGRASGQTCTGLCQQQVMCPAAGQTTSISGTVYAPNGTDPLPNVLVYIPNAPVPAFTEGVSCPVVGAAPPGSPLVGTMTAVDGTFTITNVPVGTSIPLVIVSGRWRRQLTIPAITACVNTPLDPTTTRFPRNQSEGDIPKFAIATGSADQVECVLLKVGVDPAEFTDPSGNGRINLFAGTNSPGATASSSPVSQSTLMANGAELNEYDVLMLPCQGSQYIQPASELANLIDFANAGGRVYASHYSYVWLYENPPFNTVANWDPRQSDLPASGTATVNTSFSGGQTLAQWLQLVGASTTEGQIAISAVKHDLNGVNAPTQSYLTLNDSAANNPVMQFVFDTPVGSTANQCGRVLFNEYHVENPNSTPAGKIFPNECTQGTTLTPQEKLLEYSLFELTNDGGQPTLTPAAQDFGSEAVGFNSAAQTFTWTNTSTFPAGVTSATASGDFAVVGNGCGNVPAGGSCGIAVVFNPTALGARTGVLTVVSSSSTLTSTLTGTGTPDLTISSSAVNFGSVDVGKTVTYPLSVTNSASGNVPVPALSATGDFSVQSNCGSVLGAGAGCTITLVFQPSTTGPRTGTFTVNAANPAAVNGTTALTGNGVDFSLAATPASGQVIAGYTTSTGALMTPIAGFSAPVALSCATTAPAVTCTPTATGISLSAATTTAVSIVTVSQYTVPGYTGFGGRGWLWLLALGSSGWLWTRRRQTRGLVRLAVLAATLGAVAMSLSGCSAQYPAQNASYTPAGSYTLTLSATDGFLTHASTYALNVTVK